MVTERTLARGGTARTVLTINNDGDVATAYAVEISTGGQGGIFGGFSPEQTASTVTRLVAPGGSVNVPVALAIPSTVSTGAKTIRARIGPAGDAGQLTRVTDEQFFTGRLRVGSAAAPPAAVGPQAGVAGRILSVQVLDTAPQPGQRVRVRVTYENTGSEPHSFAMLAMAGTLVPSSSQFLPDARGSITGPVIQPSETNILEVPLDIPLNPPQGLGMKDVFVQLVDLDASGSIPVRVFDSRDQLGVLTLGERPIAADEFRPGEIGVGSVRVQPSSAAPGDMVTITAEIRNLALATPETPAVGGIEVQMAILGQAGNPILQLPVRNFTPLATQTLTFDAIIPTGTPADTYGVLLQIRDGSSGQVLFNQFLPSLLFVGVPTGPGVPQDTMGLLRGQLALMPIEANPAFLESGSVVTLVIPFQNRSDRAATIRTVVQVKNPLGNVVATFGEEPVTLLADESTAAQRSIPWLVPAGALAGPYSVDVIAWDPQSFDPSDNNTILLTESVGDVFTVRTPAATGLPMFRFGPTGVGFNAPNEVGAPFSVNGQVVNTGNVTGVARVTWSLNDPDGRRLSSITEKHEALLRPGTASNFQFSALTNIPGTYAAAVRLFEIRDGTPILLDTRQTTLAVTSSPVSGQTGQVILQIPRLFSVSELEGTFATSSFARGGRVRVELPIVNQSEFRGPLDISVRFLNRQSGTGFTFGTTASLVPGASVSPTFEFRVPVDAQTGDYVMLIRGTGGTGNQVLFNESFIGRFSVSEETQPA